MKKIVIGLGFGDEGKGFVVDWLTEKNPDFIVERYCGGHQAGHRVVRNNISHVFSNFGSGTLNDKVTYWNADTFDPLGFANEYAILRKKGIKPKIIINPLCPITTPIEKIKNKQDERYTKHGSVGAGIYETLLREKENKHLYFKDLYNNWVLKNKIKLFYGDLIHDSNWEYFFESVEFIQKNILLNSNLYDYENKILESSQGLLLDMDYGFFPHCTPSKVGTQKIKNLSNSDEFYLVTRAYHTRHGNGPFFDNKYLEYKVNNSNEQNKSNHLFQGKFKIAPLNLDLLKYAITIDKNIHRSINKNLVITCMEHHKDENNIPLILNETLFYFNKEDFINTVIYELGKETFIWNIYISYNDEANMIKKYPYKNK
jgi:adenylosuccinate synthase